MKNLLLKKLLLALFAWGTLGLASTHASAFDINSADLKIIWLKPITVDPGPPPEVGKPYIQPQSKGLSLNRAAMFPDDRLIFLGTQFDSPAYNSVLITNADRGGLEEVTKLQLKGAQPGSSESPSFWDKIFGLVGNKPSDNPVVDSLFADRDTVWVGGSTNHYMGIASDSHSDAYLAKLDASAKPIWQQAYKTGNVPFIVDMTFASTDSLIVVASDGWFSPSWLALIDTNDGHLRWEKRFGNGGGARVVEISDDRFMIVGFDKIEQGKIYRENVSSWLVDMNGNVSAPTVVREDINQTKGNGNGNINIARTADGVFAVSSWENPFVMPPSTLQTVNVEKIGTDNKVAWSQSLPDSLDNKGIKSTFCEQPAITTLADGNALVACALDGQIHLYEFDLHTGKYETKFLPLPECAKDHPTVLFLSAKKDGAVFLSGSRPGGNVAPNCSWVGKLS